MKKIKNFKDASHTELVRLIKSEYYQYKHIDNYYSFFKIDPTMFGPDGYIGDGVYCEREYFTKAQLIIDFKKYYGQEYDF